MPLVTQATFTRFHGELKMYENTSYAKKYNNTSIRFQSVKTEMHLPYANFGGHFNSGQAARRVVGVLFHHFIMCFFLTFFFDFRFMHLLFF